MRADFTDWKGIATEIYVFSWKDNETSSDSSSFDFKEIMNANFDLRELKNINGCEIHYYQGKLSQNSLYEKVEKYYPVWQRHYKYDGKMGVRIFFWTYTAIPCIFLYCIGLIPPREILILFSAYQ